MHTNPSSQQRHADPIGDSAAPPTLYRPTEWWQAGCCYPSQADGVPCPSLGTDCETCDRSGLSQELRWRRARR